MFVTYAALALHTALIDMLRFQAIIKNDVTFSDDFCGFDYRLQSVASRTRSFSQVRSLLLRALFRICFHSCRSQCSRAFKQFITKYLVQPNSPLLRLFLYTRLFELFSTSYAAENMHFAVYLFCNGRWGYCITVPPPHPVSLLTHVYKQLTQRASLEDGKFLQ
jgi:hypothetical protein